MDTQAVELALDELKITPPAAVVRTRATLDKLSELDVPLHLEATKETLASQIRGLVERGDAVDPVALVRENRAGADNTEAAAVVQRALEQAQLLHERAIAGAARELVIVVRARIESLLAEARKLPAGIPTTAAQAVHANASGLQAFRALEALSARHSQLRRLHRDLIADQVDQPSAFILFGDTKLAPSSPADWPTTRQRAQPIGPSDPIARTLWLSDPQNESWVPAAADLNQRYWDGLNALQQPAKAKAKVQSEAVAPL